MKPLVLSCLLIFFLSACKDSAPATGAVVPVGDNAELQRMYDEDQAARRAPDINWSVLGAEDDARKTRVNEMIAAGDVRTSQDYYNAAMIFQHGGDTIASGMAVRMMTRAIELDSSRNKWLLAAAIDRDLMRRDLPQIYGTQYTRSDDSEPWRRYDIDTTVVTDAERREYGVETLAQQVEKERRMNLRKLYDLNAGGSSIGEIRSLITGNNPDRENYELSENGLNDFGYQLINAGKLEDARVILQLNTERHPEAFNPHDSYGEILMLLGDTTAAISAYERSLELNPENTGAVRMIERMRSATPPTPR